MSGWFRKAQENNLTVAAGNRYGSHTRSLRAEGTDRDLNRWAGELLGFAPRSIESRALGEDTAGSGQAITPQAWTSQFIDVLLPNTLIDKLGGLKVPMSTELYNYPVFTSTVSPQWIAEAGSISLDANPAFSTLQLNAMGGFKDITQYSIELAQDAYISGSLPGFLQAAIAKKMAVALDTAMLMGVTGNTGIPGLNNETSFNFRKQTGDSGTTGLAPTFTTEMGVIAEQTVKKNINPSAFLSNAGVEQAFRRIPLSTYGWYAQDPPIFKNLGIDWITSENSALAYAETDPATASSVAQSGGSYGSIYSGPFKQFMIVGLHLDLQMRTLNERYIDSGELAIFSFMRLSIRFAHPETFYRTIGVVPV